MTISEIRTSWDLKAEDYKGVAEWLLSENTGSSSKVMARVFLKLHKQRISCDDHPVDIFDFQRCLDLMKKAPNVLYCLPELAKVSKYWTVIVDNWFSISQLVEAGDRSGVCNLINYLTDRV